MQQVRASTCRRAQLLLGGRKKSRDSETVPGPWEPREGHQEGFSEEVLSAARVEVLWAKGEGFSRSPVQGLGLLKALGHVLASRYQPPSPQTAGQGS